MTVRSICICMAVPQCGFAGVVSDLLNVGKLCHKIYTHIDLLTYRHPNWWWLPVQWYRQDRLGMRRGKVWMDIRMAGVGDACRMECCCDGTWDLGMEMGFERRPERIVGT